RRRRLRNPAGISARLIRRDDGCRPGRARLRRRRGGLWRLRGAHRSGGSRHGARAGVGPQWAGARPSPGSPAHVGAHRVTDWSRLVRPSLIGVGPLRPGPSVDELKARYGLTELAKLNWNEGLLGSFPGVEDAVLHELDRAWMYPEHAYTDFREAVASWLGTTPALIVPGHGIQALIATVAHAFLDPGDTVVVPSPTYGLYAQVSEAAGARVERVAGREHRHDVEALAAAATRVGARLIWLCDPNNPTGSLLSRDEWAALLDAVPDRCAVIVDEAYVEYANPALRVRPQGAG